MWNSRKVIFAICSVFIFLPLWIAFFQKEVTQTQVVEEANNASSDDFSSIRIVCIVFTQIKNHNTRVQAIKETWGKRCKSIVFITNSTSHLTDVNVFNINRPDSYKSIWGKTKEGFVHSYNLFKDEADWFMKTDDDSFIVIENLQKLIAERKAKPEDPIWFGQHFRLFSKYGYMAGGGYVLSKESTRRFVEEALKLNDSSKCKAKEMNEYEDVEMGRCLGSVGVKPGDSRDEYLRARMFCFNAELVLNPSLPNKKMWFWNYIKHPQYFGHPGCCSDRAISYHYVTTDKIYLYNYLIYNAFVHGENNRIRSPPDPKTLVQNMDIDWKALQP